MASNTVNPEYDAMLKAAMLEQGRQQEAWEAYLRGAGFDPATARQQAALATAPKRDLAAEVDMLKAKVQRLEDALLRLGADPQ